MGWRVDERVGELKKKKVGFGSGGAAVEVVEGIACETASEQEHELNGNRRICHRGLAHFRQFPCLA